MDNIPQYGGYFLATRGRGPHPLFGAVGYHGAFKPALALYVVQHYSRPGEVVLDPFCGRGTTALAAHWLGRVCYSSDVSPLAVLLARAKSRPFSPRAVQRWLDALNPPYAPCQDARLVPFFHPQTLAELNALRLALQHDRSRLAQWVALLACACLHGRSSGFLSAPTFDACAPPPARQARRVARMGSPVYRPLAPCLLRVAKRLWKVPLVPWFDTCAAGSRATRADARRLPFDRAAAALVLTSPPYLNQIDYAREQWLRLWLLGHEADSVRQHQAHPASPEAWEAFMEQALREMYRVVRPGGYCALDVASVRRGGVEVPLPALTVRAAERAGLAPLATYAQLDGRGKRLHAPGHADQPRCSHLLVFRRP